MAFIVGTNDPETLQGSGVIMPHTWVNQDDVIWGLGGDDIIYGDYYRIPALANYVGVGNDVLRGGPGADQLYGAIYFNYFVSDTPIVPLEAGIDTADYGDSEEAVTVSLVPGIVAVGGTAEGDTLFGIDSLIGSPHDDTLIGNDGANELTGGGGSDIFYGGAGADVINADADVDYCFGGDGNDTITSGATNAILADGEGGDDTISTGSGIDYLWGGTGNDTISGGGSGDLIDGGLDNDQINGGQGIDYLYGGDGNDTINGGDTADLITGNAGDDTLSGGLGSDFLYGEAGADKFDLRHELLAGDFDYIADLEAADRIVLPDGYQPYVTYVGSGGDVILSVALGASFYNVWVDGGATPLTVAQVQADTVFL